MSNKTIAEFLEHHKQFSQFRPASREEAGLFYSEPDQALDETLGIISLRREDAARLGYDNAERWKDLLSGYATEIAKAMKIPWANFRWYAAFHNESHHPHIHMVCYSTDPSKGFLTKQGIADIKAGLAKEIFHQELTELYQKQTQRRDELNVDMYSRLPLT